MQRQAARTLLLALPVAALVTKEQSLLAIPFC